MGLKAGRDGTKFTVKCLMVGSIMSSSTFCSLEDTPRGSGQFSLEAARLTSSVIVVLWYLSAGTSANWFSLGELRNRRQDDVARHRRANCTVVNDGLRDDTRQMDLFTRINFPVSEAISINRKGSRSNKNKCSSMANVAPSASMLTRKRIEWKLGW